MLPCYRTDALSRGEKGEVLTLRHRTNKFVLRVGVFFHRP